LTDRSINDKRRQILDAAVRVFARRGYHTCRVDEIAKEAGISHGLVYHYFSSKEEVLETIFRENWEALLAAISSVEESDDPPREQLRKVGAIFLRSWRDMPDLVRVMIREVARTPHLQRELDEVDQAFAAIERIVARGQSEGSLRPEIDARLASFVFYGAVEELLTGWVLGRLPDSDEDVGRAERTLVEVVAGGLAAEHVATPA
jgi:TetR/AcrR family transcriptional regulator, fatty acid metabolism regulator protein